MYKHHTKCKVRKGKPVPPRWTENLKLLEEEVLRKKRRIKNAAPIRRQHLIDEYLQVKKEYQRKAEEAQTKSWKEFYTTQERETTWENIYRVIGRTAGKYEDVLLSNQNGESPRLNRSNS
ncbi:hypothetical protein EVAR_19842_1 [Eumeta japonica]|uniref:Uncharacterized protein n=1 Tax=Eumeta variegata TaxID=151549 RepID=A0A4C1UQS8_EUMVA|nr:hypothetical protein EVAR_19842_1 [Eumeta japonica]